MARRLLRTLALALLIGRSGARATRRRRSRRACGRPGRRGRPVGDEVPERARARPPRGRAAAGPSVYVITRRGAGARRERLLRDIPTRPGFDRDEVPPAVGRGRGSGLTRGRAPRGWKADVEYVPSGENRGAGVVMGIKLRRYCGGTRFRYVGY